MSGTGALVVAHVGATFVMVGVIWMVQLVHYPLFAEVGEATFRHYHEQHVQRITWIVGPAMLVELGTGVWLAMKTPEHTDAWTWWVALGLLGVAWVTTATLSVPMHNKLAAGFEPQAHSLLVSTNWIRTAAWSLRGALVVWALGKMLG
ncbi:MAG: hypothetical protein AAGI01_13015 [Myxococcota bacterium]